jgi:ankyrin repeat protein
MRKRRAAAPPPIDPRKLKLFFKAVKEGRPVAIRRQIATGMPVDARDEMGFTALQIAALRKDTELVELLLNKGASPNHCSEPDWPLLRSAALAGSVEVMRQLIEGGADVARFGGEALLTAVRRKHIEIARILLEAGADPNATDDRSSALEIAFRTGVEELVPILLASGARPDGAGFSRPLYSAAKDGKLDLLRLLLDAGADPNGANEYGDTALMGAAVYGQVAAAEVLKQAGARLDARETQSGETALMHAARAGKLEMARWLAAAGADIRMLDTNGKNALTLAMERAHDEVASFLREAGVPDQPEFAEETAKAREEAIAEARAQAEREADLETKWANAKPGIVNDGPFKNFRGLARVCPDGSLFVRVQIFGRSTEIPLKASMFTFD